MPVYDDYGHSDSGERAIALAHHAAIVLAAWELPANCGQMMLADAQGAALLALLCNAAAKRDASLYTYKAPFLAHAIEMARRTGWAVWRQAHRFGEQQYNVDTCIWIETALGRMSWHVRSDEPLLTSWLRLLPERDAGWDGVSMQAQAGGLAIRWLAEQGVAI